MGLKDILGGILKPVTDIVSEVVVDKDKAREINLELEKLADKADERYNELMLAQIEVNKVEAQHDSLFVAGWRPAVGWTGAAGFAYLTLIQPMANWFAKVIFEYSGTFPTVDDTLLITVLGGLLGLGTLRTYERKNGVARHSIKGD